MKKSILVLLVTALLLTSIQGFAEYNKQNVVKVMRGNMKLMGQIKKAAKASDFFVAAEHLWTIAEGMKSISQYDPRKGAKSAWDNTMEEFILTAYKGIGACGRSNLDGLNEAVARLAALNKQGHGAHK